jgi:hypothetical protein
MVQCFHPFSVQVSEGCGRSHDAKLPEGKVLDDDPGSSESLDIGGKMLILRDIVGYTLW